MTVPIEKKVDLAGRAIQALTVLLLGAIAFYGKGVVATQAELHNQMERIDTRLTIVESNRYTVADAKHDLGVLTNGIHANTVNLASLKATLDAIDNKLDYIIQDRRKAASNE